MTYKVYGRSGEEITEGSPLTDFRGLPGTFIAVTRAPITGKSGKVLVKVDSGRGDGLEMTVEQYHGVWGLVITAHEDAS